MYVRHSPVTDPGTQRPFLKELFSGDHLKEQCKRIRGLTVHFDELEEGCLTGARRGEVDARYVEEMLRTVRPRMNGLAPLGFDDRFVGCCRDFSVLLCAVLREQGTPARARCGFADYFHDGFYSDHWVCEYWNTIAGAWQCVDVETTDDKIRERFGIDIDGLNVPANRFHVAGRLWLKCRAGEIDPSSVGLRPGPGRSLAGMTYLKSQLLRDLAALNRVELLCWDGWGITEVEYEDLSPEILHRLDVIANVTREPSPRYADLVAIYFGTEFEVPDTVRCFSPFGQTTEVVLRKGQRDSRGSYPPATHVLPVSR